MPQTLAEFCREYMHALLYFGMMHALCCCGIKHLLLSSYSKQKQNQCQGCLESTQGSALMHQHTNLQNPPLTELQGYITLGREQLPLTSVILPPLKAQSETTRLISVHD